jgi:hypothetical protein
MTARPSSKMRLTRVWCLSAILMSACGPREGLSATTEALTPSNAVTDWSARAQAAIAPGRASGSGAYLQAMAHLAMYDSVVAIRGGYRPFNAHPVAPAGSNLEAAVATAAWRVVRERVPAQAAPLDAQYAAFLAAIPDGPAKTDGVGVGEASASALLAARAGDHFGLNLPYVQPPVGPGVWEPTLPTAPVDFNLQFVIPFTSDTPADFRPEPPPPLTSSGYARDLAELAVLGRVDSAFRTPAQTDVARFWSESAFTLWTRGVRNLAMSRGLDEVESARMLAMTSLSAADALISCWEAKYHYTAWRPVQAITRADTDGNPETVADPTWTALLNQNHPEYPAGHGCYGSSVVTALRRYFGTDQVEVSLDSTAAGLTAPTHHYARLSDIVAETANARVWAGLHFRHTMRVSERLGRTVARHALRQRFLKAADCGNGEDDAGEEE